MLRLLAPIACLSLFAGVAFADSNAAPLKVGDEVEAFHVKDVTGPAAGTELCYRCRYGDRPVVSIFVRKVDDNLAPLLKELDGLVGKHANKKMAAFLVVLSDDPDSQEDQLKKLAEDNSLKNTPLTTFNDVKGPRSYRINKDADVTVMMWVDGKLQVNEILKQDDLTPEKVAAVAKDTSKILN